MQADVRSDGPLQGTQLAYTLSCIDTVTYPFLVWMDKSVENRPSSRELSMPTSTFRGAFVVNSERERDVLNVPVIVPSIVSTVALSAARDYLHVSL